MEYRRTRLLDLTAVGTRIAHSLPGTGRLGKVMELWTSSLSEFHFFTDEQEDSALVTSDLVDAGNTKILQDRCALFFIRPSTR
jgi:hypothetical protein